MPTRRVRRSCIASIFVLLCAATSIANSQTTLPTGFTLKTVASGLNFPVSFVQLPDNRFYVTTKAGMVHVINVDGSVEPDPFLNLTDEVNSKHDRGLMSIELHPEFPVKPYVYLLYSHDPVGIPPATGGSPGLGEQDGAGNRVAQLIRVTANAANNYEHAVGAVAATGYRLGSDLDRRVLLGKNSTLENIGDPDADRTTLIPSCNDYGYKEDSAGRDVTPVPTQDCIPDDEEAHTVGTVRFDRDGNLFVTSGDGSSYTTASDYSLRAQRLNSLAGKLLRINPRTGDGVITNPYFDGDPSSNQSKVYALGLRSPFRMAVDPNTGVPWLGDVGWRSWEEINTGEAGNFGWPCYEGGSGVNLQHAPFMAKPLCQSLYSLDDANIAPPFYAYPNTSGASIQLGDFYTGTAYPQTWRGRLFFSDINTAKMRAIDTATGEVLPFAEGLGGITEIRAGNDSNLYMIDIYNGQLKKLSYIAGGNTPPVAVIDATPLTGQAPLTTLFSANSSYDPDGDPLTYSWDFGDGSAPVTGALATHEYVAADQFTATLTVTDSNGLSASESVSVVANNTAPVAKITSVVNQQGTTVYRVGDTISFEGTGSDAEDGELAGGSLVWDAFIVHNAHTHPNYFGGTGATGGFVYRDHEDNSHIRLCLTATDAGGLSDTDCFDVFPLEAVYSINSNPQGVAVDYSGNTLITPFYVTTTVGGTRTLSAPAATPAGDAFEFWSFGGGRSQEIVVQEVPPTVVANYSSGALPAIIQPAPGSELDSATQTFSWNANGLQVDEWKISIGSALGDDDLLATESLGQATTESFTGLPQDGRTIYVRLYYVQGSTTSFVDFSFKTSVFVEPEPPVSGLVLNVVDTNEYGFRFNGTSCCMDGYTTTFATQSSDLVLRVDGYDIDHRKEIEVLVNGQRVGYLEVTADESMGSNELKIPRRLMTGSNGVNTLEFVQRKSGYSWGVTNLLLSVEGQSRPLVVNETDTGRYGNRFDGVECCATSYVTTFESQPVDLTLTLDGFDIDRATEVKVFVNGVSVGSLAITPNNALGPSTLAIPAGVLSTSGTANTLTFVKSDPGYRWGITNLLLAP